MKHAILGGMNPLSSHDASLYTIENILDFLTAKGFRRQISMKLLY